MNETLRPGIEYELRYTIPESKTVPKLYPEAREFEVMPEVFATGYLVGLLEWACTRVVNPHIDWPREQTVGTHVDVSHEAPTPPGLQVLARAELTAVDGARLTFDVSASDGVDRIGVGVHERAVIDAEDFSRVAERKYDSNEDG